MDRSRKGTDPSAKQEAKRYEVTEWTDEDIELPYAIWDGHLNDYHVDMNGMDVHFASIGEAEAYIDTELDPVI